MMLADILNTKYVTTFVNFLSSFFQVIQVNKSANISSPEFRDIMTTGLENAYFSAFTTAYSVFLNKNSRTLFDTSVNDIQINLVGISSTGKFN